MVPTGAPGSDGDDVVVPDDPITQRDAAHGATGDDGSHAFLDSVRAMVHGEPAPDVHTDAADHDDVRGVVGERLGGRLPEVWDADSGSRRVRRAARRATKQARKHEQKLERIERRNLRARPATRPATRLAAPVVDEPAEAVEPVRARIPAQTEGHYVELAALLEDSGAPAPSRRERRRRRQQDVARAIAVSVPADEAEGALVPAGEAEVEPATSRGRRRDRRRAARAATAAGPEGTLAGDRSEADASAPEDPVVVPGGGSARGSGSRGGSRSERAFSRTIAKAVVQGESGGPPAEPESLGEYVARRDAGLLPRRSRRARPRTPRWWRRAVRITLVTAVIGACVAIPWVAPSVPQAISDLFPGGTSPTKVEDPVVAPPSHAFVGPVGVAEQAGPLVGVRLQSAGEPREVRVPRLHVDSDVVPISGQSGSLLPPSDPQVLGWWQEGREVGASSGTAVVTGHTVHTGGGALDQLDQLVVGDSVRVRTDLGWIRYVVQRTRIYSTDELARNADQLFRLDGPGRLVLITCDDWNGSFYESNAIVVAAPVQDLPTVS